MIADAHIRAEVAELGRQCEIAMALERFALTRDDLELASDAARIAEQSSARAFQAVRGG